LPPRTGLFITLEGGEGSGKSTIATDLTMRLRADGLAVTLTEEPTGTAFGSHIWAYFQDPSAPPVGALTELLMFEAARAQHVAEVIRPALERSEVVVCDRFADSSVAYQGHGRDLGADFVRGLNQAATGGLEPDLTLLLDVPVDVGLQRAASARGKRADAIGEESCAFHERVREGFLTIARESPRRVRVFDATQPLARVAELAFAATTDALARSRG
jgi:dTMP kinase